MRKLSLFFVALFVTFFAFAQVNPNAPLQRDSSIRYGKLENGLTYYIRHNEKPAQRAEYYLLTNVGAIEETPAQNGLAHFLEHMALNGTKNLPGKMMINYFESIGASFGRNINASTGVEQTMYMLNNIPTVRQGIIDTALLIMHDYSGFVSNDPEEIDKERGVIIEEWRTRRTADWRMFEKEMAYTFKGSKYATCNIIGTKDNLETFPAKELQDFYATWYRPDLQAVVVVGDIDVDAVESQLKELFKDIPLRENPQPKVMNKIPSNEEPIVGIITDPEASSTQISICMKSEPLPREYKAYGVGLMVDLINDLVSSMFYERLNDIALQPNAPFMGAQAYFAQMTNTIDAFNMVATSKDGEAMRAFNAMLTEIEKVKRFGFSAAEYDRAKTNLLRDLENSVSNAESRQNSELIGGIRNEFFRGTTVLDPKYRLEQTQGYLAMLTIDQINQMLATSFPMKKDIVITYQAPEKEGLTHPTEAQFLEALTAIQTAEIKVNVAEEANEPLLDASLLKGSKVKKETEGKFGSTEWTLKNGIKVIVKPTDYRKEEVLVRLSVDGGRSLLPLEELPSVEGNVFASFASASGVSKFPQSKLSKMLTGKIVSVTPFIGEIQNGLNASCSPKDFETMMQLMYLSVTDPRFEESEFEPIMAQLNAVVPNLVKQPNFKLSQVYYDKAYNNPRRLFISPEMLKQVSIASIEKSYKSLFSNMQGAVVIITGNVDKEVIKPMIEKYLGSLPVARKANTYVDHNMEVVPGMVEEIFGFDMSTPKTSVLIDYSGDVKYNLENTILMSSVQNVLDLIYTETIREQEGASYGVGTNSNVSYLPKQKGELLLQFDTDPEKSERIIQMAIDGIENLAKNGPTPEQLNKIKENLLKQVPESRISNRYWSNCISTYYKVGVDLDAQKEAVINSITAEKIQKFATDLLSQANRVKIVMNPNIK